MVWLIPWMTFPNASRSRSTSDGEATKTRIILVGTAGVLGMTTQQSILGASVQQLLSESFSRRYVEKQTRKGVIPAPQHQRKRDLRSCFRLVSFDESGPKVEVDRSLANVRRVWRR